jgi:hypothetical protein
MGGKGLRWWVHEPKDVGGMLRMGAPVESTAVPGVDEELERIAERSEGVGEAAGTAAQPGEVAPQFRVAGFHGMGLTSVGQRLMLPRIVDQVDVARVGVGVLLLRVRLSSACSRSGSRS